jgi:hypothetical protein
MSALFFRENGLLNSVYANFVAAFLRSVVSAVQKRKVTYQNITRMAGTFLLSIACRVWAKPSVVNDKNTIWSDKFLFDGTIHSASVLYAMSIMQLILYTVSSIKSIIVGHNNNNKNNFWSSLLFSLVYGAFDTRWRYSAKRFNNRYNNRNYESDPSSRVDRETDLTLQNITLNRTSSLSIVDEVDSEAELESPHSNVHDPFQEKNYDNNKSLHSLTLPPLSPIRLNVSRAVNDTEDNNKKNSSATTSSMEIGVMPAMNNSETDGDDVNSKTHISPPRTPERNHADNYSNIANNKTPNKTPNKSPYRRTPSKRKNNYTNYYKHQSPLLKAAARAVDRAVVKRKITTVTK